MPGKNYDFKNMTESEVADAIMNEINIMADGMKQKTYEMTNRMDAIEVMQKRPGKAGSASYPDMGFFGDDKDVSDFCRSIKSIHGQKDGAFPQQPSISRQEYESYQKAFSRYLKVGKEILQDYEQKAMQVGVGPDGGITVVPYLSTQILETVREKNPVRQLADSVTIGTDSYEQLVDDVSDDETGSAWESENYTETTIPGKTATPKFKKIKIPVHTLSSRPICTQNVLEDSSINLEQWLVRRVSEKFSYEESVAFVSGNGTGKPRGFLTYPDGASFGEIEQVAMGSNDSITADGLLSILYSLKESYRNRAAWLMNSRTVQAARMLKDGNGRYLFVDSLIAGQPSTLLGLPVFSSPDMPEISINALAVALADWKSAYLIVDRLGITVQRDPFTVKPFVEFYTRKRVGGAVINFEAVKIGKIAVA